MNSHPTHLEAARRLLELVREMTRRVAEEPATVLIHEIRELEHKAEFFADILGLLNPPLQRLCGADGDDMPEHGPTVGCATLRPPVRPHDWPTWKHQRPNLRYVFGFRLHDPYARHAGGSRDILVVAVEYGDASGCMPKTDTWDETQDAEHRKHIAITLGRWVRYLETELPRLTADTAAPAVATDGGAPEPTPDVRADGSDAVMATKQGGPTRKRRGRPKDTDCEQDKRIAQAWKTGEHESKAALAAVFNLTTTEVKHACDRHRKREAKHSKR